jgi:hypothetical protein
MKTPDCTRTVTLVRTGLYARRVSFISQLVVAVVCSVGLLACSSVVPAPRDILNTPFPRVEGQNLNRKPVVLPDDFKGKNTLLLVGYVQAAQFDIDRWILGVLQADIPVEIVEVPTIAGMLPKVVQGFIDNGMRSGIPKSDWASVVTVYQDAPKIIQALGNDRPKSSYAVLLNSKGMIVWSSNLGYSAAQVLELKRIVVGLG